MTSESPLPGACRARGAPQPPIVPWEPEWMHGVQRERGPCGLPQLCSCLSGATCGGSGERKGPGDTVTILSLHPFCHGRGDQAG